MDYLPIITLKQAVSLSTSIVGKNNMIRYQNALLSALVSNDTYAENIS